VRVYVVQQNVVIWHRYKERCRACCFCTTAYDVSVYSTADMSTCACLLYTAGITERWNASIELFHTLYGGALHSDEVVQQRSAKANARRTQAMLRRVLREEQRREEGGTVRTSERGAAAAVVGVDGVGRDAWDTPLYEHALRLFEGQRGRLP
jgi:hypothetical protein